MVASLCESGLSISAEEEPVPGVTLLSPGLGTVNYEQHYPVSSGKLHLRKTASKFEHCEQGGGKICSDDGT